MEEYTFLDKEQNEFKITVGKSFNKGSKYDFLLSKSISKLGLGRSIVVDKHNNVIVGNKTLLAAVECGVRRVRVIETTGDEIVVVKRKDIEHSTTKSYELSLTDNLISSKNIEWDTDLIIAKVDENYSFNPTNWCGYECVVKELDIETFLKEETERQSRIPAKKEIKKASDENILTLFD